MTNEQQELLDEAYKNYKTYMNNNIIETRWSKVEISEDGKSSTGRYYTQEEFINKCKTDISFSVKWGLKIEERELTWSERFNLALFNPTYKSLELRKTLEAESYMLHYPDGHKKVMDEANFPTKLITITYKDTKIENYE